MDLKAKIEAAGKLGTAAHKVGKQRAPILSRGVQDLIHGMKVGEGAADVMSAYSAAWDAEQRKADNAERMVSVHAAR